MATNLRLRPDAEAALRAAAERSGRSQQDLIRDAVDAALGLGPTAATAPDTERARLLAQAGILGPRVPYRELVRLVTVPRHLGLDDLLAREDRV